MSTDVFIVRKNPLARFHLKNPLLTFKMNVAVVTERCQTDSRGCRTLPFWLQSQDLEAARSPLPLGLCPQAGGENAALTPLC